MSANQQQQKEETDNAKKIQTDVNQLFTLIALSSETLTFRWICCGCLSSFTSTLKITLRINSSSFVLLKCCKTFSSCLYNCFKEDTTSTDSKMSTQCCRFGRFQFEPLNSISVNDAIARNDNKKSNRILRKCGRRILPLPH